ncbi:hypothetical protein J5N97_021143 [Dioscorea zingiberensis]|uniref:Uncharacterized protein n=1 Tax=Dioscorea zingiberensis TaxID=325984 RepID=A0A9D5CHW0_9LILI|nr:hypothetical protein J5N97_021143 [Dioscorea zingiberensis]
MGRRLVLPCMHSFLFKLKSPSSPCPFSEEAATFFSSLSECLRKLEESLAESSVSLQWSIEAMNVLKKLQLDLLSLLKRSDLPIISCGMEQDWFDHYMDVTITLLDLCNSIKSAMSATHRYRMAVGLAIESLSRSDDLSSRIATLNKIIECERSGREQQKKRVLHARMMGDCTKTCNLMALKGCSKKHDKSLGIIILAAKSAMLVVSLLIVSAIVSPVSIEMEGERVFTSKFPELRMFKEMLVALVGRFRQKSLSPESGSRVVLVEHEMVDKVVGELKDQVVEGVVEDKERFQSGVELLRSKSAELSECVEMFDAVVDDVFNVVMRGRNEMLGVLKDKGLQL